MKTFVRNKHITPRYRHTDNCGIDLFSLCFIIVWGFGLLVLYYLISQPLSQ